MPHTCEFCGRQSQKKLVSHGHVFCKKHYQQFKKYGRVLDTNPRCFTDLNEVHVEGDIARIDLYDRSFNKISEAVVDKKDLRKVQFIRWHLSGDGRVISSPKFEGEAKTMAEAVLGKKGQVVYADHDPLNNRRANLLCQSGAPEAAKAASHPGIKQKQNGKYSTYIKKGNKKVDTGMYLYPDEALFARYCAETFLFGNSRINIQKLAVQPARQKEIREYVKKKVQRL